MPKLSVVIITFNEERNIGRCLDSVKEVADDIVVVDSYSTDSTESICRQAGARFVQHRFEGHIEQKQWAISQAVYPHILSLDADEALSDELKQNILLAKQQWKHDGYYMNRLTNYCGHWVRHCGWYPDKKLRLCDSRTGHWTGMNPHDKFELDNGDSASGFLSGDILHYSYYSLDDHYKQVEYFTTIGAKTAFENGKHSGIFNLILNPALKFIRDYFIKLGFLDGATGFTISRISAYATYLKYKKLRALWRSTQ
jgi:glycosyltransferase involved in cell wall biosynthesis